MPFGWSEPSRTSSADLGICQTRSVSDDGRPILGQWYDAKGNWFEASVREELLAQLSIMGVSEVLSERQLDELAWGLAVELDYRWKIEGKGPVPDGYEPTVFKPDHN